MSRASGRAIGPRPCARQFRALHPRDGRRNGRGEICLVCRGSARTVPGSVLHPAIAVEEQGDIMFEGKVVVGGKLVVDPVEIHVAAGAPVGLVPARGRGGLLAQTGQVALHFALD